MNKVFLVGRLVANPEPYTTKAGDQQARITIATADNVKRSESYFFPCVAWRNTANFINTYLKKGDLVAVDGKLTRRSYITKEGKTAYVTEIVIDQINSILKSRENDNQSTHSVKTESIDKAFPETPISQDAGVQKQKQESPKFENDGDVEWFDEINKE
ncbi:MAG: single-stranded DNA-binding protein [Mycoplasmataceae bacterium]|nr:single-stranded DNA-binding protein [Mycoplasmataceae bacterium]